MPNPEDKVDIGYFSLTEGKWIKLSDSKAFNWQQGSMLQWIGPDFNSKMIFNDAFNGHFVSRIIDINTGKERVLPKAIYALDPNGKYSISLNFERSYFTRAYSYASIVDTKWDTNIPPNDGVLKIDLQSGETNTIIKLADLIDIGLIKNDEVNSHWIEHIMLNPAGNRFAFYHRYGSADYYDTELLTSDTNGNDIWKHPIKEGDELSHLTWLDNENYLVTASFGNKLKNAWKTKPFKKNKISIPIALYRKLLKPLVPRKIARGTLDSYKYYVITRDKIGIQGKIMPMYLKQDGHPSYSQNKRFLLSDTYADNDGFRSLLLCDLKKEKVHQLGKFFSPFNNCGWRADLHPRFSPDEKYIIIDSAHNGHHQILVLLLDWNKVV
jgi:hypothetical protein